MDAHPGEPPAGPRRGRANPDGPLLRVPGPARKVEGGAAFAGCASEQPIDLDVYGDTGDVQLVQVTPGPPRSESPQALFVARLLLGQIPFRHDLIRVTSGRDKFVTGVALARHRPSGEQPVMFTLTLSVASVERDGKSPGGIRVERMDGWELPQHRGIRINWRLGHEKFTTLAPYISGDDNLLFFHLHLVDGAGIRAMEVIAEMSF